VAGIRRPPKPPVVRVRVVKPVIPLHRRILGRGAVELDAIDDLRLELEKALTLDQIEADVYLDCHEALDIREAKAKEAISKATGRYVKPDKTVTIKLRRRPDKPPKELKKWQVKLLCVVVFLIFWKINIKP
jgi:hypothetical protein